MITDEQRLAYLRQYLAETPPSLAGDLAHAPDHFPNRLAFEAWRARWIAFLAGRADGPTTREEYAALRPKLYAARRPDIDQIDRFHS